MNDVICPRCGVKMEFISEAETTNQRKTIRYFYRCPACGMKIADSQIALEKTENELIIRVQK
ncbi:hypothetical protein [Metallosphaera hakonensis]|uniref:Uncharacterized protein n=1 Tax=Metallosphaera hakonensis JCM 8857 = DSM 7519 TaxID=1293036 RepID=A0A2U9IVN0_9CREN|nr:hypothetical protein [Metallosphaera hakonensis]AWS00066.1 hypothetical protein DFR87_10665 [Metallosphaera hakonensis JCM 8857 = DSM 7519]